jgi:hypothetical protein
MRPTECERDRIKANIDALARLLQLAGLLRRNNFSKWKVSAEDWSAAVKAVLCTPEATPNDADQTKEMIRLAHRIVRRLDDSGKARLASLGTKRPPDSSLAGTRFCEDLEAVNERLVELRKLL